MPLINGGVGGGDVIPPQSAGTGTIQEITSLDATVTITDPTGPITDLSVPGASDTGWLNVADLTYANSWTDGSNPAQYRKIGNQVFLRGEITGGGGGTSVTTDPIPYPPTIQAKLLTTPDGFAGADSISVSSGGVLNAYYTNPTGAMTLNGSYLTD